MNTEDTVVERLLLAEEAAEILRVAPSWVYRAARSGQLPCVRAGRNVRFRASDVRAFVEQGGVALDDD